MRKSFLFSILVLAVLLASPAAHAVVPQLMNYQGRLTDSSGEPLDTTVGITFTIYDAELAGNVIWSETQPVVLVTEGTFNVLLGSVATLVDTVFNDTVRYLGIKVGADPELTPRSRLASAPYSLRVASIDGAQGGAILGDITVTGKIGIGTATPGSQLEVDGEIIRDISRVHGFNIQDGSDTGPIISRTLIFTKAHDDTGVRVTYTDNRRCFGASVAQACRWEIRFNGQSCGNPGPLAYDMVIQPSGGVTVNHHRSETVVGNCFGLSAGVYTIQVFLGAVPGFPTGDAFTGFQGYWSLEAEEVR